MAEKIKVGVLVDGDTVPRWAHRLLSQIVDSDYAEISLVVSKPIVTKPSRGLWQKLKDNLPQLLFILYCRFERTLFGRVAEAQPVAYGDLLKSATLLTPEVTEKKFSDYLNKEDTAKVANHQLDVLIRIGFRILRGDILKAAKQGVWSYHHGDNRINRGMPAGFWEVMTGLPTTGVIVQRLTEDLDGGGVLYRALLHTQKRSFLRNFNYILKQSSAYIPRLLRQLHERGEDAFTKQVRSINQDVNIYSQRLFTTPNNSEMCRLWWSQLWRLVVQKYYRLLYVEQWILCLGKIDDPLNGSLRKLKPIIPPDDRFWADPFIYEKDGRLFILFEELEFAENHGYLSCIEIFDDGSHSAVKLVMRSEYHLSYPFIMAAEGKLYMLPECSQSGAITLYESDGDPCQWQVSKVLIEGIHGADSTLIYHDSKWWLFVCVEPEASGLHIEELHIYYADSLDASVWQPHKLNPVVADVSSARPAGAIFEQQGKLYRPSQDCSVRYGYGVCMNEITVLTADHYQETLVSKIEPNWMNGLIGVHTWNASNGYLVVDGLRRKRRFF